MSLIIAIEPDRDQAAQLKDLVRRHTGAELILADTTARAIDAIEARVPDLVLIPAFLSPEDDQALTAALRVTEAAAHVQTLTIPLLGEPQQKSAAQGVLSRLRWDQPRPSSPDSCDPKVFAEQITEYLERVAKERGPVAGTNGKGSHGSNGTSTAAETAAPATPAEKPKPAAAAPPAPASKPPAEPKPASPPPKKEVVAAPAQPPAPEEIDGLELGLSSLLEKLDAEDSTVSEEAGAPAKVDPAEWAELKELESLEYAMPNIAPHDDTPPVVNRAPLETSTTAPVETSTTAPDSAPAPTADPPAKKVTSEWGDLMESLKKDMGR